MKPLGILLTSAQLALLAFCLCLPSQGQPCDQIPPGAVAWWRGETNALDSIGTNHGVLVNGAGFASGRYGTGFKLDGADDFVEVPDSPALNFDTGDFTVSCWVKFNSAGGEQILMEKFVNATGQGWTFVKTDNGDGSQLHFYMNAGESPLSSPYLDFFQGIWHHCVARRAGNQITLFYNGEAVASTEVTGSASSPATLKIGHRDDGAQFLNGSIDELALYHRALSDAEILAMYQACPLRLSISQSTNGPGQMAVKLTGTPGRQFLIHRAASLPADGMSGGVPLNQLPPSHLRRTDSAGAAMPAAVTPTDATGFFVATDYDGPTERMTLLRQELPHHVFQSFNFAWVFTNDAPGRRQMVRLHAPGDLSLAANDLRGAPPANGQTLFLDAAGQWSTNEVFTDGFGGAVTGRLPQLRAGRWRMEWLQCDPPGNTVTELASQPFLVADGPYGYLQPSIYLHLSRLIAGTSDSISASLEMATGRKVVAWLMRPDGSQVGLPTFTPGMFTVFDGPPSDLTFSLFDRAFPEPGVYRVEARLLNESGGVLALVQREFTVCDGPNVSVTGTVFTSGSSPLAGASLTSVSALDIDDGAGAGSTEIAANGTFALSLAPGRYFISASGFDANGFHHTTNLYFVSVACAGTNVSLSLTCAPAYGPPLAPGLVGGFAPAQDPSPAFAPAAAPDGLPAPRAYVSYSLSGLSEQDAAPLKQLFKQTLQRGAPDVDLLFEDDVKALLSQAAADQLLGTDDPAEFMALLNRINGALGEFLIRAQFVKSVAGDLASAQVSKVRTASPIRAVTIPAGQPLDTSVPNVAAQIANHTVGAPDPTPRLFDLLRANQEHPLQPHLSLVLNPELSPENATIAATATLREKDATGALQAGQPLRFKVRRPDGGTQEATLTTGPGGQAVFNFSSGTTPTSGALGWVDVSFSRAEQPLATAAASFRVRSGGMLTLVSTQAEVEVGGQVAIAINVDTNALPIAPAGVSPVKVTSTSGTLTSPTGVPDGTGLRVTTDPGGNASLYVTAGGDAGIVVVSASVTLTNVSGGVTNLQNVTASILFAVDTGLTMLTYATPTNVFDGFTSLVTVDSAVNGARFPGLPVFYSLNGQGTLANAVPFTDAAGRSQVTFLAPATGVGTSIISAVLTFDRRNYTNTIRVTWEPLPSLCGVSNAVRSAITAWWPGDFSTNDVVGGRNALLRGGATYEAGLVTNAFSLNGNGQFVEVPHSSALDVGTGDFTFEVWVRFNNIGGEQVIAEKYVEAFGTDKSGWTLTKIGSSLRWALREHANLDSPLVSTAAINTNWTHLAVRRLGSMCAVFQNGVMTSSSNVVGCNLTSPSSLKFGHRGNPTDTPGSTDERQFWLNGAIDEPTLYVGRALTDGEILAIYTSRAAGKCR